MKTKLLNLVQRYSEKCNNDCNVEFWLDTPISIVVRRDAPDDTIIAFYVYQGEICCITEWGYDIEASRLDEKTLENLIKYIEDESHVTASK